MKRTEILYLMCVFQKIIKSSNPIKGFLDFGTFWGHPGSLFGENFIPAQGYTLWDDPCWTINTPQGLIKMFFWILTLKIVCTEQRMFVLTRNQTEESVCSI